MLIQFFFSILFTLSVIGCNSTSQDNSVSRIVSVEKTQEEPLTCESIEEALKNKDKVHTLWLRNRKDLKVLDPRIGQLINLRVLHVSGTNLTELPEEIGNCSKLEEITANASKFRRLPESIGKLMNLSKLNFGYNQIEEFPLSIINCTALTSVSFGSNKISVLPKGFGNLKNVWFCDFADNNLTEFPKEFNQMESIGNLWLHGNEIKSIPLEIQNLKNLTHLLIDLPEITNLAEIHKLLPELRIIDENNR